MRIGIDARPMDTENKTGIGVYVDNLVESLAKIDDENEYILYFSSVRRGRSDMPGPSNKNFTKRVIRLPYISDSDLVSSLWMDLFLPYQLKRDKVDVFHSTYAYTPKKNGFRSLTTIHDLNFMACKELTNSRHARHCQSIYSKAMNRSDILIAVSENTARDIRNLFPDVSRKSKVVYSGRDERFKTVDDINRKEKVRQKYKLPERFILVLGSDKKRKNISGLIRAYNIFLNKYKLDYKLVITGKASGAKNNTIFLGYVPLEDLVILYNLAGLFIYPSLYEGFGFPVLEAMACGVPVLASNVSSIPEIIKDRNLLFNPYNDNEIANSIYNILSNSHLRKACAQDGIERVKAFDWQKTAREMLSAYNEAYGKLSR